MNERRVEQLYMFVSTLDQNPPATALGEDELADQHMAYIQRLKDQGLLVGAGSLRDSDGKRYMDGDEVAGGIIIVRGDSLAGAEALAREEPYCREGQRRIKIMPWRRTWFED
ncbi:MAG: YciI family protein [Alphaproteobacteria bacterium]|nr:YciI family protein [Alphaproteobacteria bacterium]